MAFFLITPSLISFPKRVLPLFFLSLYSNSKEALALFQIHPSTPKSISN
jgi:hypothetical protein